MPASKNCKDENRREEGTGSTHSSSDHQLPLEVADHLVVMAIASSSKNLPWIDSCSCPGSIHPFPCKQNHITKTNKRQSKDNVFCTSRSRGGLGLKTGPGNQTSFNEWDDNCDRVDIFHCNFQTGLPGISIVQMPKWPVPPACLGVTCRIIRKSQERIIRKTN